MKSRRISNEELFNLGEDWNNAKVDTSKYYCSVLEAYEVDNDVLDIAKAEGALWQIHDDKIYVGLEGNVLDALAESMAG